MIRSELLTNTGVNATARAVVSSDAGLKRSLMHLANKHRRASPARKYLESNPRIGLRPTGFWTKQTRRVFPGGPDRFLETSHRDCMVSCLWLRENKAIQNRA